MNRCSVCAREIPETRTVCDVCDRWGAEPVAAADSHAADPHQPPLPEIQPAGASKVAYFPSPLAPVAPVTPAAPAPPVVSAPPAPQAPVEEAAPLPPVPHAAPVAAVTPPPAPVAPVAGPAPIRPVPPAKRTAPAALGMLKGRRGAMAGLGAAAVLVIAFLVARPAPPVETAPVIPKQQAAKAATKAAPSPVPQVENALQSAWNVNSKRWGANQKKSIAVELTALDRVPVWMRHVQPMLVVRCVAKSTEAFVFTDSPIAMEPDTPDHTVRLTFDDEPEQSEKWPDSVEHDSLFAPNGAAFARRLLTARSLKFGFTPHNSRAVVAQFQVSGLRALIEPVAKDCGWK